MILVYYVPYGTLQRGRSVVRMCHVRAVVAARSGEARMFRRCLALLVLALTTSCGSSRGPGSVLAPATVGIVVSPNSADHPDFLCDGVEDDVEINQALRRADSTVARTV